MQAVKRAEDYENMLSSERERFQRTSRKLLNKCMLVRDKSIADRQDYIFLNDHFNMLMTFLDMLGYHVMIDKEAGVIRYYVPGEDQTNTYRFKITDKIMLWCLFQLYNEKIEKNPQYSYTDIRFGELVDIFEKYQLKDKYGKHGAKNSLNVMKKFNIISTHGRDLTPNTVIRIYSSIRFCLNEIELKEYAQKGAALLKAEQDKANRMKAKAISKTIFQAVEDDWEDEEEEDDE